MLIYAMHLCACRVEDRVTVDFLQPSHPAGTIAKQSSCPAAALLGIDVNAAIALKSPTNFMGPKGAAVAPLVADMLNVSLAAGDA
jgi:hypothetical protein